MTPGEIAGVVVITPEVHSDDRGTFAEMYRREWLPVEMVQQNHSRKRAGTVVGLHYHLKQYDYWYVASGSARVVLHDLRAGSPTERRTMVIETGFSSLKGILIPPGVAHGFSAVTAVEMLYMIDRYHDPSDEFGVAWDDSEIVADRHDWGVSVPPRLSARDRGNPRRSQIVLPPWTK